VNLNGLNADNIYSIVHVLDAQKFQKAFEDAKKIMVTHLQNNPTGTTVHTYHYCEENKTSEFMDMWNCFVMTFLYWLLYKVLMNVGVIHPSPMLLR